MIILPAIDLKDGKCVRLRQGKADDVTVYGDDPALQARDWREQGGQELHVVDLDGAFAGTPRHVETIRRIIEAFKGPVEVGGGLRTPEAIAAVLDAGAARAIIGSAALEDPELLSKMVELYGEPSLYNYYCSNDCKIGMDCRIDEVKPVGLAEATLGILSSVNAFNKWKDKFIDIAMDGDVDDDEKEEFKAICKALGEISTMVERLKLTVETSKFSKAKNT